MKFLPRLREWGSKKLGSDDPKAILTHLHVKQGKAPQKIGDMFAVTGRTVRLWMGLLGVPLRSVEPQIVRSAKELGFGDLGKYFQARWGWSYERMGEELKVTPVTVSDYYEEYVKEVVSEGTRK